MLIRFRIDWDLHSIYKVDKSYQDPIITRIKILSRLKIDENRKPQDGQIVFPYKNKDTMEIEDVDMRVSTFPILYWEKVVIRILRKDVSLLNLDNLWFLSFNLDMIKKSLNLPEWLILVAWPTWSWKTTTLYAVLNYYDPSKYNISTLEDPVEYKIPGINQSEVKPEIGYTFANGLRTLLRQDPDIILVWEIRDHETAKLAVEASLTWHLVLWTIHANRGIWVVERLTNMWIEKFLVASSLNLIVSQRLVKKLCTCAEPLEGDELKEKMEFLQTELFWIFENIKSNINLKKPKWCPKCYYTWYYWRLWVHEVIPIDKDFRHLIMNKLDLREWEIMIKSKWFLNLYQDWLIKAAMWLTEIKQVLSFKSI